MKEQAPTLKIFLRKPTLPAIIISKNELLPCTNMDMLAAGLMKAEPEGLHVNVVDSIGEEFWYIPEQLTLAPGFFTRKWTKLKLIDLVNRSSNTKRLGVECSTKGLSNRRFTEIMNLMIALLVSPPGRENGEQRRH